jgi:hypothetical protein
LLGFITSKKYIETNSLGKYNEKIDFEKHYFEISILEFNKLLNLEMDIDLRIVGFNYGSKGTKNESVISVLQLESECGLLKTAPGGMTEAMMADITNRQKN